MAENPYLKEFPLRIHQEIDRKDFMVARWDRLNKDNPVSNFQNWDTAKMTKDAKNVRVNPLNKIKGLREKPKKSDETMPDYDEYNKKNKEIKRMLKKGYKMSKLDVNDLNWDLDVRTKPDGKTRSFKGTRESINEGSMYFILTKTNDGAFEAAPVSLWYNFKPQITYRTLTIEEAEDQWENRGKIHNHHSLMDKIKKAAKSEDQEEDVKSSKKIRENSRGLTIFDNRAGSDDDEQNDSEEEYNKAKKKQRKSDAKDQKRRKMAQTDADGDQMFEEKGDGDSEGDEVDYQSDNSSVYDANEVGKDVDIGGFGNKGQVMKEGDSDNEHLSDGSEMSGFTTDSEDDDKESEKKEDAGSQPNSRGPTPSILEEEDDNDEDVEKFADAWGVGDTDSSSNTPSGSKRPAERTNTPPNTKSPVPEAGAFKRPKMETDGSGSRPSTPSNEGNVEREVKKILRRPTANKDLLKKLFKKLNIKDKDERNSLMGDMVQIISQLKSQGKLTEKREGGQKVYVMKR